MKRRAFMVCLILLAITVATGCRGGTGAKATVDANRIRWGPLAGWLGCPADYCGFIVPVNVTLGSVPSAGVVYSVKLASTDGWQSGEVKVRWKEGESATSKEALFFIHSRNAGDTQVYARLQADYESNNLSALREDASALLRVSISRAQPEIASG